MSVSRIPFLPPGSTSEDNLNSRILTSDDNLNLRLLQNQGTPGNSDEPQGIRLLPILIFIPVIIGGAAFAIYAIWVRRRRRPTLPSADPVFGRNQRPSDLQLQAGYVAPGTVTTPTGAGSVADSQPVRLPMGTIPTRTDQAPTSTKTSSSSSPKPAPKPSTSSYVGIGSIGKNMLHLQASSKIPANTIGGQAAPSDSDLELVENTQV